MILLLARTGSHLYGNNHPDSDKDFYCITATPHPSRIHKKSKIVKHMSHRYDMTQMDLGTFSQLAYAGRPQALEAMYAPQSALLIDNLREYRQGFRASLPAMRRSYNSLIDQNCHPENTIKQRFHCLRWATNLLEAQEGNGRFNPRLDHETIKRFTWLAQPENYDTFIEILNCMRN